MKTFHKNITNVLLLTSTPNQLCFLLLLLLFYFFTFSVAGAEIFCLVKVFISIFIFWICCQLPSEWSV